MSRTPKASGVKGKGRQRGRGGPRARRQIQEPRSRILITLEGEVTEPEYFRWLARRIKDRPVALRLFDRHSDPVSVVNLAISKRDGDRSSAVAAADREDQFDDVWAVVDVDEHKHLDKAVALADREGVNLAISGPCFESWLIMHFRAQGSAERSPDNKRLWARTNSRPKDTDFSDLPGKLGQALGNAQTGRKQQVSAGRSRLERNPCTEVDQVLDAIAKLAGLKDTRALY